MALNSNFNELATTTLNLWASMKFADAFSGHNPLFYRLRQQGNIQTGGLGLKALEPWEYPSLNAPSLVGVTSGYNQFTPTETEGWTNAEYSWCEKAMDVSVEQLILDQQGPETRKLNYLDQLKSNRMKAFMEGVNADMWRDPSLAGANGASRAYFGSLRCYFNRGNGSTPTSIPAPLSEQVGSVIESSLTTVGGIDRTQTAAAYWCTPVNTSALTNTQTNYQSIVSLATRGNDRPDLIITTRANYNVLAGVLLGLRQYLGSSLNDAGFKGVLNFDGCDVFFDDNCPASTAFAINTEYLKFRANTMKPKFTYTPDPDRLIERWKLRLVGQITSGNLGRVHARASNITG